MRLAVTADFGGVECVDYVERLAASQAGGSAIDEAVRDAVERVGALTAAQLQRDVKTTVSPNTAGACTRWFAASEHAGLQFGFAEVDAVGLAEIVLGAAAARIERDSSALERRILAWQLRRVLSPLARAIGYPLVDGEPLVETASLSDPSWERFTLRLTIGDVDYDMVIAFRPLAPARSRSAQGGPRLDGVPVEIEVGLRAVRISWGELAGLRAGDVIRCDHPAGSPIAAWAGDRPIVWGVVAKGPQGLTFEVTDTYVGVR